MQFRYRVSRATLYRPVDRPAMESADSDDRVYSPIPTSPTRLAGPWKWWTCFHQSRLCMFALSRSGWPYLCLTAARVRVRVPLIRNSKIETTNRIWFVYIFRLSALPIVGIRPPVGFWLTVTSHAERIHLLPCPCPDQAFLFFHSPAIGDKYINISCVSRLRHSRVISNPAESRLTREDASRKETSRGESPSVCSRVVLYTRPLPRVAKQDGLYYPVGGT